MFSSHENQVQQKHCHVVSTKTSFYLIEGLKNAVKIISNQLI